MKLIQKHSIIPLVIAVAMIFLVSGIGSSPKQQIIDPVVKTQSGLVKGLINETGTVAVFKGIPVCCPSGW